MTDTASRRRPYRTRLTPATAPPEMDRFVTAMRRLQDLVVVDSNDAVWSAAAGRVDELSALLEGHTVPPERAPAGRAIGIAGLGHSLMPPWITTQAGPDGVTMHGHFTRFHAGSDDCAYPGAVGLLFDWQFGVLVTSAGLPLSRTGYLHLDYLADVPIEEPLIARGAISSVEGRKAHAGATLTTPDGTVLAEASALMVALLPHHS